MSNTNMITNMSEHMTAFLMSHGGIDMDQFYEDYGDVTVDGIVEAFTSKLIDAIGEEDNMEKLKALVPKRGPKKSDGKIKDPNKPTRGKSAYLFFCAEKREQAKEEILEETEEEKVTVSEVTKKLAAWWDELKGDEDRKEELEGFVLLADEDKERYREEMEGYTEPTQEELKATVGEKKKRGTAKKKDPDAPKRPKSAYIYFCAEYRESVKADLEQANEEVPSSPEVMSELGVRWQDIKNSANRKDVAIRKKYEDLAAEDKARYEGEKATSKSTVGPKAVTVAPKAKAAPKATSKSTVVSKKLGGFAYYCQEVREDVVATNPKMSSVQVTQELGRQWTVMDDDEKVEWRAMAEGAHIAKQLCQKVAVKEVEGEEVEGEVEGEGEEGEGEEGEWEYEEEEVEEHPRPKGRAPKGKEWNSEVGRWEVPKPKGRPPKGKEWNCVTGKWD